MKTIKFILVMMGIIGFLPIAYSQNVGINDDNSAPDPSAMLDVKASDKGILVPRIQLTDVNNPSPVNNPAIGLLVYANSSSSVEEGFYYWDGTKWQIGMTTDNDTDSTNELQTLTETATTITLSDGGGTVSKDDADADPNNEIQTLTLTGSDLSISGGNSVSLPAGSVQNLSSSKSGNNVTVNISDGGTGTTFDITDDDSNSSNEIQTISLSGSTITLSNGGGSISNNDADASTTNELQNLSQVLTRGNDAGNNRIVNLGNPIDDDDAVTKSFVLSLIDSFSSSSGFPYLEDFESFTNWHPASNNSSGCSWTASNGFAQIASMATIGGSWVWAFYETNLPLYIPPGTDFSLKAHIIVMDGDPPNTLSATGVTLLDNSDMLVASVGHNDSQASSGYGGIHINSENGFVFNSDPDGFSTANPQFSGILEIRRIGNVWSAYVDGIFSGSLTSGGCTLTATKLQIQSGRYSTYEYRDGKIDFIIVTLL